MLSTVTFASVMMGTFTFGTLDSRVIPVPHKTHRKHAQGYVYIVQPSQLIVGCEDDADHVHYFLHTEGKLQRCLWTRTKSKQEKADMFFGLRGWYERVTQVELTSSLKDVDDVDAWVTSSGLDDI
jgi:hypothetical protein